MLSIALLCLAVSVYFLRLCVLWISRPDEPPYVPGARPILGHLPTIFMDSTKLWTLMTSSIDQILSLGGTVRVGLGPKTIYMVADPDDMLVIVNSCLDKGINYEFAKSYVGNGLVTSDESTWRKHRKLLNPAFSQTVLDTYICVFNDQARKLVEDMKKEVSKGRFDQRQYIKINSIETICRTAFGVDFTDAQLKRSYGANVEFVAEFLFDRLMKFWLYPSQIFRFSQLKKKQDECIKELHNVSNTILQNKKRKLKTNIDAEGTGSSGTKFRSFIEILLELSEKGVFSDTQVREHTDTLIAAGSDTATEALVFAILMLGANPTAQEKVHSELAAVLGDEDCDVQKKDFSQLVYLDAVIKESLRLYTVVPIILREIRSDVKLKKYTLYAGHTCGLLLFGANVHPMWGPDRHQFRPERWLDPTQLPKNSNAFAAFSFGKRSCIGKVYVVMVLKTMIAHLVRNYTITADDSDVRLKTDLTLKPVSGYFITIEDRKSLK